MTDKFVNFRLSDIIILIGGGTPKTKNPEYWNGDIPWLSVADFNTGYRYVHSAEKSITQKGLEESSTTLLKKGQLIISARGTVGIIAQLGRDMAFNQSCYGITAKEPLTTNDFLYYLISNEVQSLKQITHGGVFETITRDTFDQISVNLPPLATQSTIAQILGSLDDKIEVNRQMNENLEAMARTIFKSWFVDFDPVREKAGGQKPLGMDAETAALFPDAFEEMDGQELPVGWAFSTIGEEVQVVGGSTPSTKNPNFWEYGLIPFATPKDMSHLASSVLLETERCITDVGLEKISSGLLPKGTVLLSSRAPIGYLALACVPVAVNQGFIAMICNKNLSNYYVLYWTQENMETIKANANGSTFQEISKKNFRPIKIVVPSHNVLVSYNQLVHPIHEQIVCNTQQSRTLVSLRDALLPKLMSGEIQVKCEKSA